MFSYKVWIAGMSKTSKFAALENIATCCSTDQCSVFFALLTTTLGLYLATLVRKHHAWYLYPDNLPEKTNSYSLCSGSLCLVDACRGRRLSHTVLGGAPFS